MIKIFGNQLSCAKGRLTHIFWLPYPSTSNFAVEVLPQKRVSTVSLKASSNIRGIKTFKILLDSSKQGFVFTSINHGYPF